MIFVSYMQCAHTHNQQICIIFIYNSTKRQNIFKLQIAAEQINKRNEQV